MNLLKMAAVLYFAVVSLASGAEITAQSWEANGSNFSRLTIFISGPIESGDAKKVTELVVKDGNQAFDDWHDRVAILDSLGGSYTEAIALMQLFRKEAISTYIPENAKCMSACALAFMAGTDTSVYFRTTNRVLHPKGELGFHAPSLNFSNTVEIPGSGRLLNQTYASALRSIAQVVDQMEELVIEESLLSAMLATSPNDMRTIKTVDDANRWKIQLDIDPPTNIPRRDLGQLCVYFENWNRGASVTYEQSYGVDARNIKSKTIQNGKIYYFKVNEENDNTCYVKQAQQDDANFEVFYSASSPESVINSIATSNVAHDFASAQHLLRPQEEIKRLPSSTLRMKLPEDIDDPNTAKLFCEQFNGETRVKASRCLKYNKNGENRYRWDDGSETVTQNLGKLIIDGVEAGLVMLPNDRLCWRNRETGATFCAHETQLAYNGPRASSLDFATATRTFNGGCRQGKRWSSQIYDETPKTVRVGLYHCVYLDEHEGQPAPLEFVCSPGDEKYVVRSAIDMPHTKKGQQVFFQIDRLGILMTGRGEHNEMTDENDLKFEVPLYHELIDSLAAGTSATIQAGKKKIAIHLKDSKIALRYLELCQKNPTKKSSTQDPANIQKSFLDFSDVTGTWTGIATQPNSSKHQQYKVILDIFEKNGQLEFTANYPELRCDSIGNLVSHVQQVFAFTEQIANGRSRCIDGGFLLTIVAAKKAAWNWEAGTATATLLRRK